MEKEENKLKRCRKNKTNSKANWEGKEKNENNVTVIAKRKILDNSRKVRNVSKGVEILDEKGGRV